MITLKLRAGLGNQLFQYAYARALALRSKTDLRIDLNWFSNIAPTDTKRIFLLDAYNLPKSVQIVTLPSPSKLRQVFKRIKAKISRDVFGYNDYTYYHRRALPVEAGANVEVEGFWNTEKYFKDAEDTIRKELTLKEKLSEEAVKVEQKIVELGKSSSLILIHVRRGDYVSNAQAMKHHGLGSVDYYTKAVQNVFAELEKTLEASDPTFILASDDMEWVKENIVPLLHGASYEILSNPTVIKDFEELHLMSLCHHFIIANSSFSWWAAWLSESAKNIGKKKIVVGPKQWVANSKIDTRDVMPEDWIRI